MPNWFASFLAASVLSAASVTALAQPASAQTAKDAPSTTVAPVTVTAAPQPKVIEKQTHNFVQSYAAPNVEIDQITRWHDPVCVQVVGLPQADQAALIKARIESVAQAVGLRAARPNCNPNVEIVFTPWPQRTMDVVAQRNENLLGYYHRHDRDQLKTVTHPIQAWYMTATEGGGEDMAGVLMSMYGQYVNLDAVAIDDPDNEPPLSCGENPHFTHCLKSMFHNVFMVADSKALEGKDAGLVADDMAMLALSQPKSLDGCNALPSVIDVFAKSACPGRDPPDGLTPADAAYLTALYASDPEGTKASEQSEIALRMAKILIKANVIAGASAGSTSLSPANAKAR
jgi:hypothetical protein